jgi:hypothetical protein
MNKKKEYIAIKWLPIFLNRIFWRRIFFFGNFLGSMTQETTKENSPRKKKNIHHFLYKPTFLLSV